MAADEFGDKTHEATPYRRQKAREDGQVVRSQDLASAALLVGGLVIVWYFAGGVADSLGRLTQDQLGGQAQTDDERLQLGLLRKPFKE